MSRAYSLVAAGLCLVLGSGSAFAAAEIPVQARFFAGAISADLTSLNQEIQAQGLDEFSGGVPMYGVEATYPVLKRLELGLNFTTRIMKAEEGPEPDPLTEFEASLNQTSILAVARVPLVKSNFVRFDVVAGVGGSNTIFKLKSATQEGELSKKVGATLCTRYGASLALGYKKFFVVFEGGMESNKADTFVRSGTISDNIQTIDLSGSYASIGILFDGMAAKK